MRRLWFCHHGDAIAAKALYFHSAIYIISVGKVTETEKKRGKNLQGV